MVWFFESRRHRRRGITPRGSLARPDGKPGARPGSGSGCIVNRCAKVGGVAADDDLARIPQGVQLAAHHLISGGGFRTGNLQNALAWCGDGDLRERSCHVICRHGPTSDEGDIHHRTGRARRTGTKPTLRLTPVLDSEGITGDREKVRSGLGVALRPDWRICEDSESGRLVRVLPQWHPQGLPIHVVYRHRLLQARTRALVDFSRQTCATFQGSPRRRSSGHSRCDR